MSLCERCAHECRYCAAELQFNERTALWEAPTLDGHLRDACYREGPTWHDHAPGKPITVWTESEA